MRNFIAYIVSVPMTVLPWTELPLWGETGVPWAMFLAPLRG